jgi:ornithine cyclodeaminase/alanine dehydrogenase-like protein (mu-crystallin family)
MNQPLPVLDAAETRAALPMTVAIEAMAAAFGDDREVPVRHVLGGSAFMSGRVGKLTGVKVVSLVPGSPAGIVAVFDEHGVPLGIVDGPTLTAIRTGAGCGLATQLLAAPQAATLAMLGAGAMAFDQVAAVQAVRPITTVLVWSRSRQRAEALAGLVGGEVVDDANEAVAAADVVSTATPATAPLFSVTPSRPIHVNAVGSHTPAMCELPSALVSTSFVVVDDRAAAAAEAGDLIRAGKVPDAELSDVIAGRVSATPAVTTIFKSVGIASQDVAAAAAALRRA